LIIIIKYNINNHKNVQKTVESALEINCIKKTIEIDNELVLIFILIFSSDKIIIYKNI